MRLNLEGLLNLDEMNQRELGVCLEVSHNLIFPLYSPCGKAPPLEIKMTKLALKSP